MTAVRINSEKIRDGGQPQLSVFQQADDQAAMAASIELKNFPKLVIFPSQQRVEAEGDGTCIEVKIIKTMEAK